jgi:hypothetical protein
LGSLALGSAAGRLGVDVAGAIVCKEGFVFVGLESNTTRGRRVVLLLARFVGFVLGVAEISWDLHARVGIRST